MKTGTGINAVRSVHFGVPDLAAATRYYVDDWGLTVVETRPDAVYFRATGADYFVLALHRTDAPHMLMADIGIDTREQTDVLHASLKAAGIAVSELGPITDPGGGYGFTLRDPGEGRVFRIVADAARHEDTADVMDRPRKIAHLVYNSTNRDDPFFVDYLGFRVIDRSKTITFLNCNSDHHSLAFYIAAGSSFNHLAFELPDLNSVMSATGNMVERGHPIGWGVGRHGPCDNVFSYFVSPGGFVLEYTSEVEQVDESYKAGGPDDWNFRPGRRDQWGLALPTAAMRDPQVRVVLSDALFAE